MQLPLYVLSRGHLLDASHMQTRLEHLLLPCSDGMVDCDETMQVELHAYYDARDCLWDVFVYEDTERDLNVELTVPGLHAHRSTDSYYLQT